MTLIYNRQSEKRNRKSLRKNATPTEKIIWEYLRGKKLLNEKFYRQYSVGAFVIDFYCSALKLAVELDGSTHFESDEAIGYDKEREKYIRNFNIEILRFRNDEVYNNVAQVISTIEENIKRLRSKKNSL